MPVSLAFFAVEEGIVQTVQREVRPEVGLSPLFAGTSYILADNREQ